MPSSQIFTSKCGQYSGFLWAYANRHTQLNGQNLIFFHPRKPRLHGYEQHWKHPKFFWISVFAYMFWKERVISSYMYAAAHSLVLSTRGFVIPACINMMTSSNGNIFRVTGTLCGEFTGEFPTQRPVTPSFDVFFDLRLNKRLSKQSWGLLFETPSRSLWRHCNEIL